MGSWRSIMRNRGDAATCLSRRHRMQLHRCANSGRSGGFGPMSLPLFHTGGRDLAIVHGQSPLSETFQPAMVRMPARCFAAAVGRNFP